MASEWPFCRLEELAAADSGSIAIGPFGSRLKADCYVDEGVALIRGTNLSDSAYLSGNFVYISDATAKTLGNANLKPNDLVFPHRGSIGAVGIVPRDGRRYVLSTSLMKVSLDETRAVPAFYYYYFRSAKGRNELLKNASQVGTPGIATPLTSLRACLVPCATVQEQLNAVGVLSALDERIALLRQSNITLEAIARALFKSWFVDFDPVRAKAEGREPDGMDAANAVLFPSGFRTSELGSIPVGWQSTTLAQLADLNASKWTNRKHPRTLNYIELSGVTENRIAGMTEVAFSESPSRALQHLRHGDTIVGTVRPGNLAFAYIDRPQDNLTGSTGFAVLSPRKAKYASFIYLAATRGESIERLVNLADGGAYPAVRPTVVAETPCIVPPDEVMVLFSALTRPLLERIAHNRRAASTISELRDTLLPRLFSGKLRLPDVGATIENAAA